MRFGVSSGSACFSAPFAPRHFVRARARLLTAEDALTRSEIKAPLAGTVAGLKVHTTGERTALEYFLQPIIRGLNRAFREQ